MALYVPRVIIFGDAYETNSARAALLAEDLSDRRVMELRRELDDVTALGHLSSRCLYARCCAVIPSALRRAAPFFSDALIFDMKPPFFLAAVLAGGRLLEVVALEAVFFGAGLDAGRAFGRFEVVIPFLGAVAVFVPPERFCARRPFGAEGLLGPCIGFLLRTSRRVFPPAISVSYSGIFQLSSELGSPPWKTMPVCGSTKPV